MIRDIAGCAAPLPCAGRPGKAVALGPAGPQSGPDETMEPTTGGTLDPAASPPSAPPGAGRGSARPPRDRSEWMYALLAVNLIVLASVVWWVADQVQAGGGTRDVEAAEANRSGVPLPPPSLPVRPASDPDGPVVRPGIGRPETPPLPLDPPPPPPPPPPPDPALAARAASEIEDLALEIEVIRSVTGAYPSTSSLSGGNRGSELLSRVLHARRTDLVLREADTDGDGRPEIVDPWGRPYLYVSADDYGAAHAWTLGAGEVETRAVASPLGGFHAARRFQIRSAGPDGVDGAGGGDDVVSWVR